MRLRATIAAAACLVAAAAVVLPAQAAESGDPVVITPQDGSDVALDFSGPVIVDFSGAADGTYSVEVDGHSGDRSLHEEQLGDVVVNGGGGTEQWDLGEVLAKPGQYSVNVAGNCDPVQPRCASYASSYFTVAGGQAPTVLGSTTVRRRTPWTLRLDWSLTPIGMYDIYSVARDGTRTPDAYSFQNYDDLTVHDLPMAPLRKPGWQTVRIDGVETTDPAYQYSIRIRVTH